MRALILNGTLKPSPQTSNTEGLARYVAGALRERGVDEVTQIRLVDHDVKPGVESDMRDGDAWPAIREQILDAEILVVATPTWLGQLSSVTKRALERMDAFLSETGDDGVPVAYNRVAGMVVTGNEDGAHAIIANVAQALIDIGFTVPAQAWTYWNKGPGPGEEEYLSSPEKDWTHQTGDAAAQNLVAVARALKANPIPKPPNG